jgi:hypothetical protein
VLALGSVALSLCLSISTLSSCSHAVVALLYPFSWQHTFIPVLPASMIDIVCCPTPFLVGLLSSSLPKLKELPVEEVSRPGATSQGKGRKRERLWGSSYLSPGLQTASVLSPGRFIWLTLSCHLSLGTWEVWTPIKGIARLSP